MLRSQTVNFFVRAMKVNPSKDHSHYSKASHHQGNSQGNDYLKSIGACYKHIKISIKNMY